MTLLQFFDALFGPRPWCKERRRFWPRALKWVISFGIWGILIGLWVFTQQLPAAS